MKRRRRNPFQTTHASQKIPGGEGVCRSPMEKRVFSLLDQDPSVTEYSPEPFRISYFYQSEWHVYIPDILVRYHNSIDELIEVKPIYEVSDPKNIAKFEAAKQFAEQHGIKFKIQVVRGVSRYSYYVHTIEKKYEDWQDAVRDWKALIDDQERERVGKEQLRELGIMIKGIFGWVMLIYIVLDVIRACK